MRDKEKRVYRKRSCSWPRPPLSQTKCVRLGRCLLSKKLTAAVGTYGMEVHEASSRNFFVGWRKGGGVEEVSILTSKESWEKVALRGGTESVQNKGSLEGHIRVRMEEICAKKG